MRNNNESLFACAAIDDDVQKGWVKKYIIYDSGSIAEPHYIFVIKMRTDIPGEQDPTRRYNPTGGSHFFPIRPNEHYTKPAVEEGQQWNVFTLSCPHPIPCPILAS
jgi:hypothetical protein